MIDRSILHERWSSFPVWESSIASSRTGFSEGAVRKHGLRLKAMVVGFRSPKRGVPEDGMAIFQTRIVRVGSDAHEICGILEEI